MIEGVNGSKNSGTKRGRGRIKKEETRVQTLDRGISVLEMIARAHPISLSEISRRVELHPSTTFRFLETLRQRGYVQLDDETGLYTPGLKCFEMGSAFLVTQSLPKVAEPYMNVLVERFGENVNLVVRDQAEVVYMHQVEGVHSVRMFTRLAARLPLYCTGAGKVLLIGMPKKEVIVLMGEGPYRAFTENTITTPQALYRAALQAKQLGYGVDDEERESGVRCVAAPIYDQGSKVCAALSISAPTQRLPKKQFKQVGTELIQQAEQISARLGFIKDVAGDR